jgi:hypothetical protein
MPPENHPTKLVWLGRAFSLLAGLPFCLSSAMKFSMNAQVVQGMAHFGWPASLLIPLAILEAGSVLLYFIPRIAVLGGIVLTGYLGGAIATELRIGEPVYMHIVLGLLIWGGLYLREPRLHALLPVRKG